MKDVLDLLILDAGSAGRAVAYAQSEADTAVEVLSCHALNQLKDFRDRLNRATNGQEKRPTPQDLSTFGTSLFGFVLRGDLLALYNRLPSDYIRIRILSNHPELQALPWEYLQDPRAPAGPNNTRGVVRIVPTLGQRGNTGIPRNSVRSLTAQSPREKNRRYMSGTQNGKMKRRPNQEMKPTSPPRNAFSVFTATPCRGLSFSR